MDKEPFYLKANNHSYVQSNLQFSKIGFLMSNFEKDKKHSIDFWYLMTKFKQAMAQQSIDCSLHTLNSLIVIIIESIICMKQISNTVDRPMDHMLVDCKYYKNIEKLNLINFNLFLYYSHIFSCHFHLFKTNLIQFRDIMIFIINQIH